MLAPALGRVKQRGGSGEFLFLILDDLSTFDTVVFYICLAPQSGRALRKLPFQAHAFFGQGKLSLTPSEYARCLVLAVGKEQQDRKNLELTSMSSKK